MSVVQISFEEGQANLDWLGLCRAFDQGTNCPVLKYRTRSFIVVATPC